MGIYKYGSSVVNLHSAMVAAAFAMNTERALLLYLWLRAEDVVGVGYVVLEDVIPMLTQFGWDKSQLDSVVTEGDDLYWKADDSGRLFLRSFSKVVLAAMSLEMTAD